MKNATPAVIGNRGSRSAPSSWWAGHFQRDLQRDWTIPWECDAKLINAERERIASSIAEFQRGESSEAHSYLAKSQQFGAQMGDAMFHVVSRLFVESENLHARLLLRFMQQSGIPTQQKSPRDGVFRWLRSLGDLGWTSRILLIAELVAQEYYPCLRAATTHPILTRICDRIISEEAAHIRFQVERIAQVENSHPRLRTMIYNVLQFLLMSCAASAVYLGHHRVLGVKMGFAQFCWRVHGRQRQAAAAIRTLRQRRTGKAHALATNITCKV